MSGSNNRNDPARARMLRAVTSEPRRKNPFLDDDDGGHERPAFVPLGNLAASGVAFLDSHGAIQMWPARDLSRNNLARFFSARPRFLIDKFPRLKKGQNSGADSFAANLASDWVFNSCGFEGAYDPRRRLRGRGAWLGEDGDLVLHLGDRLWTRHGLLEPGLRGEKIYPQGPPLMRPASEPVDDSVGEAVLALLDKWQFKQPELAKRLLLGWCGSAMIAGALDVRPAVWVTGNRGTGKTTLLERCVCGLFGGGESILRSTNTTAAGCWQMLGYDCIPVQLDEAEPSLDNRKLTQLVEMMRTSYSGGDVQRGSAEGSAHQYPVRSSFMFGSINVMPLKAQDRSRCAVLELDALPKGQPLLLDYGALAPLGRRALRRMCDEWPRLRDDVLPRFRGHLIGLGWDGRGADTYGTLFACASVLMFDAADPERELACVEADLLAMGRQQALEEMPDYLHIINHVRGYMTDQFRGNERRPLGELIRQAAGLSIRLEQPQGDLQPPARSEDDAEHFARTNEDCLEAQRCLMGYGMKVTSLRDSDDTLLRYVAVANLSAQLNHIMAGTHWAGVSGTSGVWRSQLMRAPGAVAHDRPVYFRDGNHRVVLVPLWLFLDLEGDGALPTE